MIRTAAFLHIDSQVVTKQAAETLHEVRSRAD